MNEETIEFHYKAILQYTYLLVGNRHLAEDLTQDAFVKALKSNIIIELGYIKLRGILYIAQ